jgi:hypothetical protein
MQLNQLDKEHLPPGARKVIVREREFEADLERASEQDPVILKRQKPRGSHVKKLGC